MSGSFLTGTTDRQALPGRSRHNGGVPTQRKARHGSPRAGLRPVQLRFKCSLTDKEYVNRQAWCEASLPRCPLHPHGGCSLARHGTYERVSPPGTHIPRWYCSQGHCTFSLLADCFSARLSGTLREVEAVVDQIEQSQTLEAAVAELRTDIELPGALRWTRRRAQAVHLALGVLRGLLPDRFARCQPTLRSFRQQVTGDGVLNALRDIAAVHLCVLPPPLGFLPPLCRGGEHRRSHQHRVGPDPPRASV